MLTISFLLVGAFLECRCLSLPEAFVQLVRYEEIHTFAAQGEAHVTSRVLSYEPDRVTLLVQNDVRGLLMGSETVFPGWEAYVDGLPTPILRAQGLLRAVILPPALAGRPHEVTFVYRPMSLRLRPWRWRPGAAEPVAEAT